MGFTGVSSHFLHFPGRFFTTEPPGKFCHFSFPCGLDGNKSAYSAGHLGLILGLGRSTRVGNDCALQFSSILAWRIPWTEGPGRLQSMESQRVRRNWATNTFTLLSMWHESIWNLPTKLFKKDEKGRFLWIFICLWGDFHNCTEMIYYGIF